MIPIFRPREVQAEGLQSWLDASHRAVGSRCVAALVGAVFAWLPAPGAAFELFDGRLEIHGSFGQQVRAIGRDLDPGDGIEIAQWYNVLEIEIEANLAPDGFGPFEIVEAFARLEARYDCVWTGACRLAPERVNTFGNEARHMPKRMIDGGWPASPAP